MAWKKRCFAVAFLALLLLSACQGRGSATAEQAAAKQALKYPPAGAVVDPTSIEFIQSQPFEDGTYVVLSYKRMWNDRDEQCLMMTETHQELFTGWVAGSGAGACSERSAENAAPSEPMQLSGGTQSRRDQKKPDISHVLGKVNDPAIVKVRVTWKDGQSQEVQVINSTFIAIRSGNLQLKTADGLNSANVLVYHIGF